MMADPDGAPEVQADWSYVRAEEMREAERVREWQEKRDALLSGPPPKPFRPFPKWANSLAFYAIMAVFAAVFGSIIVRWLTGGH